MATRELVGDGRHRGARARWLVPVVVAVMVVVVGVLAAVLVWFTRPAEPPIFAALRAREAAATATAEATTTDQAHGACVAPSTVDLGPLADLGSWDSVCIAGPDAPAGHVVSYHRAPGSAELGLTYTGARPTDPYTCIRRITGDWWAVKVSDGSGCPAGFTFQGA